MAGRRAPPGAAVDGPRTAPGAAGPKVEIGWLLEGDLPQAERDDARQAAAEMAWKLSEIMPQFDWVTETLERPADPEGGRLEPVRLLDAAEIDRDLRGWDFAFAVTARELHGRERPRVLGITSSIFATALISTAFLFGGTERRAAGTDRLLSLAMHLFGRLAGVSADRSASWMRHVGEAGDLDGRSGFDPQTVRALAARMEEVADLRVEEMQAPREGRVAFYAHSLWRNRGSLPGAVRRMRPWSFPLRLRRLTTAAGSALAVLVMTAETWEVAANLSLPAISILSLAAIAATSGYLVRVQRLLASRRGPLREQRAVTNAGTVIAVAAGMSVTYAAVFAVASLLALGLFGDPLIARWTGADGAEAAAVRLRLAALAASLSVVIGALGASFEPYGYFRHVTQIDDEI